MSAFGLSILGLLSAVVLLTGAAPSPRTSSLEPSDPAPNAPHTSVPAPAQPLWVGTGSLPPMSGSKVIDGTQGGALRVGRWLVTVPAGAYSGIATIHLVVPNPARLECSLEIDPVSLNQFAVPVQLSCNGTGAKTDDPHALVMGWFDPAVGKWVQVPGSSEDRATFTVRAPLQHFSRYGVCSGKAGW